MSDIYSYALENIFCGFIRRDQDTLQAIDAFSGALEINGDALEFTVPALFEFVCGCYETASGQDVNTDRKSYLRFRKELYQNPTNSLLMAEGGLVELATPNPDHDLVRYTLVRIA